MVLFAPTKQSRIKCEKIPLNNLFDKILHEYVQYSVPVGNATLRKNEGYGESIRNAFMCILHIQFGASEKA